MLRSSKRDAKVFAQRTGKKWVNSKLIDYCAECDQKFTMINRKHHCRQCGEVICGKCSPDRVLIGDASSPLRICRSCFIEHQKFSATSPVPGQLGSVDKDISPSSSRHNLPSDFNSRYEKIKNCYTSNKYSYGPCPSQYFVLHVPREILSASAALTSNASSSSKQLTKSIPIVVLIHGGFWDIKFGINSSNIESLVPFFLSKGMAVCQIEYRRIGGGRKQRSDKFNRDQRSTSIPSPLSTSPNYLQKYSASSVMYMHVSHQFPTNDDNWERKRNGVEDNSYPQDSSLNRRTGDEKINADRHLDDEGGFPHTNEDVLQALRYLHHKCNKMNSTSSGVDSFTHHYIAANGSRCISRLAKMDTSRIVLLGHSGGGYLSLWSSCNLNERKLPFHPLLSVAVAPLCNLEDANKQRVGGNAVQKFLKTSMRSTHSPSFSSDDGEDDGESSIPASTLDEYYNIILSACPSRMLPLEVPLILVCGTKDSHIPTEMVEDFYWKAKESYNVDCLPSLSMSATGKTQHTTRNSNNNSPSLISNRTGKVATVVPDIINREDDMTAFVRESVSHPIKLLKMPEADHYSLVSADHQSFLKLFDELFVIAPSLADIPELDILLYGPDEVRVAMEYDSTSNSNSINSNDILRPSRFSSEKVTSNNSLENINEDDGTNSGVDSPALEHSPVRTLRESNLSHASLLSGVSQNKSSPVDSRISDCMQLVDTVDLEVENLLSCTSSDDGSSGYFAPLVVSSGYRRRQQRSNTQDSRESSEHEDTSHHGKEGVIGQKEGTVVETSISNHEDSNTQSDSVTEVQDSTKESEDLELFSFPTPINKAKRRPSFLPKFI